MWIKSNGVTYMCVIVNERYEFRRRTQSLTKASGVFKQQMYSLPDVSRLRPKTYKKLHMGIVVVCSHSACYLGVGFSRPAILYSISTDGQSIELSKKRIWQSWDRSPKPKQRVHG